jgi:hypothetical protein
MTVASLASLRGPFTIRPPLARLLVGLDTGLGVGQMPGIAIPGPGRLILALAAACAAFTGPASLAAQNTAGSACAGGTGTVISLPRSWLAGCLHRDRRDAWRDHPRRGVRRVTRLPYSLWRTPSRRIAPRTALGHAGALLTAELHCGNAARLAVGDLRRRRVPCRTRATADREDHDAVRAGPRPDRRGTLRGCAVSCERAEVAGDDYAAAELQLLDAIRSEGGPDGEKKVQRTALCTR